MSILSLRESEPIASEADWLCRLIDAEARRLREARLGRRFRLEGAAFHLFRNGRNVVYTIERSSRWFLKMHRRGNLKVIEREMMGAGAVRDALGTDPAYAHPDAIRASTTSAFVLSACIPGRPLNRELFAACWTPRSQRVGRLHRAFHTFGVLLARFHAAAGVTPGTPPATTRAFGKLTALLAAVPQHDHVTHAVADWARDHQAPPDQLRFVHGNIRLDNVLVDGRRLAFLDFENCGSGSVYEDVSRPCTQLALMRIVPLFPWRRALAAASAFLDGYGSISEYDRRTLGSFITSRIARYYIETLLGQSSTRIGGIPVRKSRLEWLTLSLVRGDAELALPGVRL